MHAHYDIGLLFQIFPCLSYFQAMIHMSLLSKDLISQDTAIFSNTIETYILQISILKAQILANFKPSGFIEKVMSFSIRIITPDRQKGTSLVSRLLPRTLHHTYILADLRRIVHHQMHHCYCSFC